MSLSQESWENDDLWAPQAEKLVATARDEALKAKRENYNQEIQDLYDWYRGVHADLTDEELADYCSAVWEAHGDEIRPEYVPVLRYLIEELAVCCAHYPQITLRDEKGVEVPGDNASVINLRDLLSRSNALDNLHEAEKLRALCGIIGLHCAYRDKEYDVDIVLPDRFDVMEDDVFVKRVDKATAITIANESPQNPDRKAPPLSNTVWAREVEPGTGHVYWWSFQVDEKNEVTENPLFPDNTNRYHMHPFVVWHESPPVEGIFPDVDDTMLRLQANANLLWTDFGETLAFAGLGQKWIKSPDVNAMSLPYGPRSVIRLEGEEDSVGMLEAQADPEKILRAIIGIHKLHAVVRHLSASIFDLETPSIQTGAALVEGKADMMDVRIRRAPRMAKDVKRLIETLIRVYNHWEAVHDTKRSIDEKYTVHVSFWAPVLNVGGSAAAAQADAQAREFAYKSGRRAVWEDWLQDRDIDPIMATPEQIEQAKSATQSNALHYLNSTRTPEDKDLVKAKAEQARAPKSPGGFPSQ